MSWHHLVGTVLGSHLLTSQFVIFSSFSLGEELSSDSKSFVSFNPVCCVRLVPILCFMHMGFPGSLRHIYQLGPDCICRALPC